MSTVATYPLSTIAKLLMLTDRRVQQLAKEGHIPKPADRGRYELVPTVQAYIKFLKDRAIGADMPGDEGDHKRRLLKARADIAEMEVERLGGTLVELDEVERVWGEVVSTFGQRVSAIAHRAAPLVAVETDADSCHEILEALISEARGELSASIVYSKDESSSGYSSSDISDDSATSEADDLAMGGQESETVE